MQTDAPTPRTAETLGAALSDRYRKFADLYLVDCRLNASAAAHKVRYKDGTPKVLGGVERRTDVYGDKSDEDGLSLVRQERTCERDMWVYREHEVPVAGVRR